LSVERRILIQSPAGFEHADHSILYDGATSRIVAFSARTILPDGTSVPVPDALKQDTLAFGHGDQEVRNLQFTYPAVEPGAILELSYQIHEKTHDRIRQWRAQESIPVIESRFRVRLKQPVYVVPLHVYMVPRATSSGACEVTDRKSGSRGITLETVCRNLPAFREEPQAPPAEDLRVKFAVMWGEERLLTLVWAEFARGLHHQIEAFVANRDRLKPVAATLTADCANESEKVNRVYDHVKRNLTARSAYSASGPTLELGDAGLDGVLDTAGGSVDEITLFTLALLRESGVQSKPIAVKDRTLGRFAHDAFDSVDHLMLQVVADGQAFVLDPSCRYCQVGVIDSRYSGIGPAGVRIGPTGATLIELPTVPAQFNSERRSERIVLAQDGSAQVEGEAVWGGQVEVALRSRWADLTPVARQEEFLLTLAGEIDDAHVDISDPESLSETLRARYRYRRLDLPLAAGRLLVRPTDVFSSRLAIPMQERRRHPIRIPYGYTIAARQVFALPYPARVVELPEKELLVGPALLFKQEWSRGDNRDEIVWDGSLEVGQTEIPVTEYPRARDFGRRLRHSLRNGVIAETAIEDGR
jgi:hypothetical protein